MRLRPIGLRAVRVTAGLWAERRRTNRDTTIPHGAEQLESAGNLANFRMAAKAIVGEYRGGAADSGHPFPFLDSDVYKWLEAVGWELAGDQNPPGLSEAEEIIDLVGATQQDDGYLNTFVQVTAPGREFCDLQWGHELYTIGHLIQAGIAWHRSVDDDRLLAIARRAADRIDAELGPGRRELIDGHPEIEMALVELYRVTGAERYLQLASTLLDRRGRGLLGEGRFGSRYWQDHEPVRQASEPAGHAVRQVYLDCGAVDVAVETGDRALLDAVIRRWESMVGTRMYVTGGIGAHHRDEAFGDAYELPPDRAYAETCAAIGSVMLSWRLLLATGEPRYADLIERTGFNAVLTGLALDGRHFYYSNPLHRRHNAVEAEGAYQGARRRSWYACACCPPNLMRFLAAWPDLVATVDAMGLQLHQFAAGSVEVPAPFGPVRLAVETDYPWDGAVEATVAETPASPWALSIRVPAWCRALTVEINDTVAAEAVDAGVVSLPRIWHPGDRVRVSFDMPPRITLPDPRIDAVRGCVAIERGPIVYAVEEENLSAGSDIDEVVVDPAEPPVPTQAGPVNGMTALVLRAVVREPRGSTLSPYIDASDGGEAEARPLGPTLAVPYLAWGNRQPGGMRVWLPVVETHRASPPCGDRTKRGSGT